MPTNWNNRKGIDTFKKRVAEITMHLLLIFVAHKF